MVTKCSFGLTNSSCKTNFLEEMDNILNPKEPGNIEELQRKKLQKWILQKSYIIGKWT